MDLETKIDLAIHNANISDEVIQCLCEDVDYNQAFNQMIKHDEGSFHDLFLNEETYSSIFEHFIKNVKPFRMFYKTELEELLRQEILDNQSVLSSATSVFGNAKVYGPAKVYGRVLEKSDNGVGGNE